MKETDILIAILSGGAAVAVIEGIREWLSRRDERKAKKEELAQKNIEKRLSVLEQQNAAQSEALKYLLFERIRFLGQRFIAKGEIDFEDRRTLHGMHEVYHSGLSGNGDLDQLMRDVNALKLKHRE